MDRLYGKTVSPEPMMQSTKLPVPMACRETTAQKQMIALINSVPETNKQIEPIPFFFSPPFSGYFPTHVSESASAAARRARSGCSRPARGERAWASRSRGPRVAAAPTRRPSACTGCRRARTTTAAARRRHGGPAAGARKSTSRWPSATRPAECPGPARP